MAQDKKSIIVYADWIDKFEELTDDEAGKLIKHFFRYVNDLEPIAPDRTTKLMFIDLQNTLKRDLEKWENKLDERSISGRLGNLKRYYLDIYNDIKSNKITLEQGEELAKTRKTSLSDKETRLATKNVAKLADSDSVSDSVNVNDIKINNIDSRKLSFAHSLKKYLDLYSKETIRDFYEYWAEPNKSNTKFRQELQKTWDTERRLKTWNKNNFNNKPKANEELNELTTGIRASNPRI